MLILKRIFNLKNSLKIYFKIHHLLKKYIEILKLLMELFNKKMFKSYNFILLI